MDTASSNRLTSPSDNVRNFLVPNLQTQGRVARGAIALVLGIAALFCIRTSRTLGLLLLVSSLFSFYEAARGWCVLRACGIRTKI